SAVVGPASRDVPGDAFGEGLAPETPSEAEGVLRGFLSQALFEAGLYCRADDRGDPVVQLAPPLICGPKEFDQIESILRTVLTEAWARL
ncbi:aspartate aminotransferase family protein, partial [Sphaerisporangium sp. NPDC049002]